MGTTSKEEGLRTTPTFRGSVLALSAWTGQVLWRTYTVPAGYAGGAMWGSQLVVDHQTNLLWGSGYHTEDFGLGYNGDSNKLYAVTLNGH